MGTTLFLSLGQPEPLIQELGAYRLCFMVGQTSVSCLQIEVAGVSDLPVECRVQAEMQSGHLIIRDLPAQFQGKFVSIAAQELQWYGQDGTITSLQIDSSRIRLAGPALKLKYRS